MRTCRQHNVFSSRSILSYLLFILTFWFFPDKKTIKISSYYIVCCNATPPDKFYQNE
jgi:uncharacterized membrane protein (GlpM family)